MRNFSHKGDTCTFVAPYAVLSGGGFLVGAMFAVAATDAAIGATLEGDVVGVFTLAKNAGAGTGFTQGTKIYWDNAAKNVTKTSGGNVLIGASVEVDAADADVVARIRLNGTTVV